MVRESSSIAVHLSTTDCPIEEAEISLIENAPKTSSKVLTVFRFASNSEKLVIYSACALFFCLGSGTILQTLFSTRANVGLAFGDESTVLNSIRGHLSVVAGTFVLGAIASFLIEWTAEKQIRRMRVSFYRSLLEKDQSWYDTHDINKMNADIEVSVVQLRDGIGLKLGEMIKNISIFLIGTTFAFCSHWQLAAVLSVPIPLLGFTLSLIVRRVNKIATQARAQYATAGAVAEEALGNIRTVQAFGLEDTFLNKFIRQLDRTLGQELQTSLLKGSGVGMIKLLLYACNALGWWYGGRFVRDSIARNGKDGRHAAQRVMAAFFTINKAGANLNYIAPGLASLSIAGSAASAISDIIGAAPRIDRTRVRARAQKLRGDIEFREVSFAYPTNRRKPIYDRISFKIHAGETIALVGPSGCGKSTTIQLLQRFYDLDELNGSILIDDVPIEDYDLTWLRDQMALVSQEPRLFCKTLGENIRYGRLDATDAEIRQAAIAANADKFIMNLPDQYNTSAGLGGGLLSGGQKQRIAIARAILRDPAILILDEATSALDTVSEKIVQRALDSLLAESKRTTIIIAHRLSTIRNADRIFVLNNSDDGAGSRVVESGSHDELMRIEGGLYKRLINMQEMEKATEGVGAGGAGVAANAAGATSAPAAGAAPASVTATQKQDSLLIQPTTTVSQDDDDDDDDREKSLSKKVDVEDLCPLPTIDKPIRRLWLLQLSLHPLQFLGSALGSATIGGVQSASGVLLGWWMITFLMYDDTKSAQKNSSDMYSTAKVIAYVYLAVAVLFGAAQFLEAWLSDRISHLIVRKMRERVFGTLLNQEMQFFDIPLYNVGFLQQILSSDCELAKTITGQNFSICVQAFFCLILGVSLSFHYSWKIAAPLLCVYCLIIPMVFIQTQNLKSTTQSLQFTNKAAAEKKKGKRKGKGKNHDDQSSGDDAATEGDLLMMRTPQFLNNELMNNLKTIIAYNLQTEFLKSFEQVVDEYYEIGVRNAIVSGIAVGVTECAVVLAVAVGFSINYYWLKKGEFEFEPMIKALLIMFLACNGTTRTAAFTTDAHRAKDAASNIFTIINKTSQADPRNEEGIKLLKNPQINFNHIKFTYPQRPTQPILFHVHFNIRKSQTVALVGESGCGKSTIIQFLMRFYDLHPNREQGGEASGRGKSGGGLLGVRSGDVTSGGGVGGSGGGTSGGGGASGIGSGGNVEIDGVDIQDYNLKFLRSNIGLVSQEPILFDTSIRENILFGNFKATEEEIVQAAKLANAHEFISQLSEGYLTHVGRQGGLLSGGQKQRIAIARALIRNPKILLLDEATSALDPESELAVQHALDQLLDTKGGGGGGGSGGGGSGGSGGGTIGSGGGLHPPPLDGGETTPTTLLSGERTTIMIAHRLSTIRNADLIVVFKTIPGIGSSIAETGTHEELMKIPNGVYRNLVAISS